MAAGGWAIVERFARERERRSEAKQMVEAFSNAVTELIDGAGAFYALPGEDMRAATLATTIRLKFSTLFEFIDTMKRSGLIILADEELKRFRQAVTGGEFESRNRNAMAADGPLLTNISATGQQLNHVVRLAYYESFVAKVKKR